MRKNYRKVFTPLIIVALCLVLCGGCEGLKYHHIFVAGVIGAGVGGIVGHQSDECPAGIAIGAAVFATGELLHQIDHLNKEKVEDAAHEVSTGNDLLSAARAEP